MHPIESCDPGPAGRQSHARYELAGPQTLSHREIIRTVLRAHQRRRVLFPVPTAVVSRSLRLLETAMGPRAPATWDEAELMEVPMVSARGTADAERLGVAPQRIGAVLGTS